MTPEEITAVGEWLAATERAARFMGAARAMRLMHEAIKVIWDAEIAELEAVVAGAQATTERRPT